MTDRELLSKVDHTLLRPTASWEDIKKLCEEGTAYRTASVCIPSAYVERVKKSFPLLTVCTVVGFPFGYGNRAGKTAETRQALDDGADEIDMVVNLGDVKNGNWTSITDEIRELKELCGSRILKVIAETCYLTEEEKVRLCGCVTDGGGDYIKTSTGFGTGGATTADVALFRRHVGSRVQIKASGGIHSRADMEALVEAGASRLGMSGVLVALGRI